MSIYNSLNKRIEQLDAWVTIIVICNSCKTRSTVVAPMSIELKNMECYHCGDQNMITEEICSVIGNASKTDNDNDIISSLRRKDY